MTTRRKEIWRKLRGQQVSVTFGRRLKRQTKLDGDEFPVVCALLGVIRLKSYHTLTFAGNSPSGHMHKKSTLW